MNHTHLYNHAICTKASHGKSPNTNTCPFWLVNALRGGSSEEYVYRSCKPC